MSIWKRMWKLWIITALCVLLVIPAGAEGQRLRDKLGMSEETLAETQTEITLPLYRDVRLTYEQYAPGMDQIALAPQDAQALEGGEVALEEKEGAAVLMWDKAQTGFAWNFNVEDAGLYQIELDYMALASNASSVIYSFALDGETPFDEAANIALPQTWVEREEPFFDINGDEVAPGLVQLERFNTYGFYDVNGLYAEPLVFYLAAGEHTLTLTHNSGAAAIREIRLHGAETLISYDDYKAGLSADYAGEAVVVQGEDACYRSDLVQRRYYYADSNTQPFDKEHIRRNVIGGWRWQSGNQILTWELEAPETAAYSIVLRGLMDYSIGVPSARRLEIDGEVPFQEATNLVFRYDREWQGYVLQDENGEPYRFQLEKGTHQIAMTAQCGDLTDLILDIRQTNRQLSDTLQDIIRITGVSPDVNFKYELDEKIPGLLENLTAMADSLDAQRMKLEELCQRVPQASNVYVSAVEELRYVAREPDRIPEKLDDLITVQSSLADAYMTYMYHPLAIDYLALAAPGTPAPEGSGSFMDKLNVTAYNFMTSFTKNYDNLSRRSENQMEVTDVIEVWIGRSKEWGELVQTMADEEFTPETGVAVKVNIIPGGTSASGLSPLMLSIITGNAPDVVVGGDSSSPFELAIRGAALDLTQFEDFDEVAQRFFPNTLTPFTFDGGVYALPETLDTSVMFYRTDIFNQLGLKPPTTWEELTYDVIPVLKQNGYQFYMSTASTGAAAFDMFLWQNGGDYYNESLTETGLSTDVAYRAFEQWTRMYTMYDTPEEANAFNHFRVGDIPLYIGSLSDYMMISAAAPDLYGRWAVTNVPGTVNAAGELDITAGGTVMATMIFSQTEKADHAWSFLKWWTSDAVQDRFATEIEAMMSRDYRWYSANMYAFANRNTDAEDMQVFLKALHNVRYMRPTIGGYITTRHVNNAWTRVVVDSSGAVSPRDSIEEAIKEINRELRRKQIEYQWEPKDE